MLNVCTPSAEEQKEIAAALAKIPRQPLFSADFEISHGRSTLSEPPNFLQPGSGTHVTDDPSVADYVRIRHEFSVQALFSTVQYSFSNDGQNMVETLVLHVREPKDLIQVSMEDSASSVSSSGSHGCGQHARRAESGWNDSENPRLPWPDATARRMALRLTKAPTNRSFAAPQRYWQTIAGCWRAQRIVSAELAQIPGATSKEAGKGEKREAHIEASKINEDLPVYPVASVVKTFAPGNQIAAVHRKLKSAI